jgi:predicted transcriptional regulator
MQEYIQEAIEIVKAQAGVRNMTEEELASMLKTVSQNLKSLYQGEEAEGGSQEQQAPVDPKKAIREKSVVCLECGKTFKSLGKRHLATHGLTPAEYRQKWGYKKSDSLIAKSLARERRKKMKEMQLWKRRKDSQ